MPNSIDTTITQHDVLNAKIARQSPATAAQAILNRLQNSCPYGTTFIDGIPHEQKGVVEAQLKKAFELWANTWIAPLCREIIAKQSR